MYYGYYPSMYRGYGGYYDSTMLLILAGLLIGLLASALVRSSMNKYAKIRNYRNITGAEAAARLLQSEGLYDVQVRPLNSDSGDHYDPRTKTVNLSYSNYYEPSITSMAVACHECGHAIQHAQGYAPLNFRSALIPAVNFANKLSMPILLIGMLLGYNSFLMQLGILAFALTVLFQLVTLPVEFDASHRALIKMEQFGFVSSEEYTGCKKVLTAAAFTYVAAALSAILSLVRLILLTNGGSRRRR